MENLIVGLLIFILANVVHLEVQSELNRRDIKDLKRKFVIGDFSDGGKE